MNYDSLFWFEMKMKRMNYKTTSIIALVSMVIMFGLSWATSAGQFGGRPIGEPGTVQDPLIIPAGWAFAIWSIIYLGLLIFPIYQLTRKTRTDVRWKEVHMLFSLNVILNGVWLVFASYDWLILTVLTIVVMLYTLYRMNELLRAIEKSGEHVHPIFEQFPISVYFAWITLATALNFAGLLAFYEWDRFGLSEVTWSLIIIPIVALIASLVFQKYRDSRYAAVVVWAFVALAVKQWTDFPMIGYMSVAVVLLFGFYMIKGQFSYSSAS